MPRNASYLSSVLKSLVLRRRYGLAALSIPLLVRAIPEVIAGPYPIGYDTISSYVPLMIAWPSHFTTFVGGWLVFGIFGIIYSTIRIDPIIIVKVAGPVLYGILGVSEYAFARGTMKWGNDKALTFVIVGATYFVSLRMSWDLLRNVLGLALMLLTIVLAKDAKSTKRLVMLSVMTLIVTMAHLLAAVLLISLIAIEALFVEKRDWKRLGAVTPAAAYCLVSLVGLQNQGITLVTNSNASVEPLSAYAFPVYVFLPLLPLALLGTRVTFPALTRNWLLICILGIVAATTPLAISTQLVSPDRWTLMMFLPVVALSVEGLFQLRLPVLSLHRWRSIAATIWIVILLILAVTYVGLQAENAFPYYRYLAPSSMLQSSIPARDNPSVVNAFRWLSNNSQVNNSAIIAHNAIYGWALEYYTGKAMILGFDPGTSFDTMLQQGLQRGYTTLYTVWWANGDGWYGQPNVSGGFLLEHQDGDFGVFMYRI